MNAVNAAGANPSAPAFDLAVQLGDGARGLSRVMNVLALLDISPLEFTARAGPVEQEVSALLVAEGRDARLALERLRALPCVRAAQLSPRNAAATHSLVLFADC